METRHVLLRHLMSIAALLIALVLILSGCANEVRSPLGESVFEIDDGATVMEGLAGGRSLPPMPPDSGGGGETPPTGSAGGGGETPPTGSAGDGGKTPPNWRDGLPRAVAQPVRNQGLVGDWWNSKGTIAALRFTLNRGWYSGILLSVSARSRAKGFSKGDVAYRVQRVSQWVYEGQVLSRFDDGRQPHWKQRIRFIISSQNPNTMKGYGKYGSKTQVVAYSRRTR
ncbi:MAG: hypothetical protein QGH60_02235 [Phycisphaerae bacterium]|nr:hypothetical protein [Phycisphaerae bacterium]